MRFDDSLTTVLASDAGAGFGAEATWRQLVDLIGRGKVADVDEPVRRLRALRGEVADGVRAASARALAFARPPAALVALFAEDELAIAAPVLRTATLREGEWLALLPDMTPRGRSVLRHRRDLPPAVVRGLESFGRVDFTLEHDGGQAAVSARETSPERPQLSPLPTDDGALTNPIHIEDRDADRGGVVSSLSAVRIDPHGEQVNASITIGEVLSVPVPEPLATPEAILAEAVNQASLPQCDTPGTDAPPPQRFEIADLVARIDAFQRERPEAVGIPTAANDGAVATFAFRTDAGGIIRWLEGGERAALIGLSLRAQAPDAFARRARLDITLDLPGDGAMAGGWRLEADAVFDPIDGRFAGYRGGARRPPAAPDRRAASDALRQLVHELRTPTNAIAGFAELIETQLLGPVAPPYREQAGTIRGETAALVGAIDDLDIAARLAGHALDLAAAPTAVEPLLARVVAEFADARLRYQGEGYHIALIDDRALERLLRRLLSAVLAVAAPAERLRVRVKDKAGAIAIQIDRPAALALADAPGDALARGPRAGAGGPLLGIDFAIDLARDFAAALGGSLAVGAARLTLRLPTALDREVGQAAE